MPAKISMKRTAQRKSSSKKMVEPKNNDDVNEIFRNNDFRVFKKNDTIIKMTGNSKRLFLPSLSKRMNKIKNYGL